MSLLRSAMLNVCSPSAAVASPEEVSTQLPTVRSPGHAQRENHELAQDGFNNV